MLVLEKLKQYDRKRLIIIAVAAIAAVAILVISLVALLTPPAEQYKISQTELSTQSLINSIVQQDSIEVPAGTKRIQGVERCYNAAEELVAYAVTATGEGFRGTVSVKCYFKPNSKVLIGVRVAEHIEDKAYGSLKSTYYGAEIADSVFTQRFDYAVMPIWFYDGSLPVEQTPQTDGTRIDALSGATVSSQAVISAVETAYTYYTESVL